VALRRLELAVRRHLDGILTGDVVSRRPGLGSEPAGARLYLPGDDARRIDWSLTARSVEPYVRTTEADRELETWIVADRSSSLDFGTAQREKREAVLAAAAGFGFLAVGPGNRLGLVITGGRQLVRRPAAGGRQALMSALSVLYDTERQPVGPAADADVVAALGRLERVQHRRSQIVVISDFLERSEWGRSLGRLARRHQVIAVHVVDPRELELPAVGILSVIDTETGQRLDVQTAEPGLRQRYAEAAAARHRRIRESILGAGAEYLCLRTDRDWLAEIAAFASRRRGRARRGPAVRTTGAP
jgi:uncharacterized protein (DUF58 family)